MRRSLAALALLLVVGTASPGPAVAGEGRPFVAPDAPLAGHPRVAVLPLENFSGKNDVGETVTRIVFFELVRAGICEAVELGEVNAGVDELRLRDTGALTDEQARKLGERLSAPYLLVGTVLECGMVYTPDGQVPSAALSLRMLEARSNRVVWADLMARTGEDKETLFGWGREYSPTKLAQGLAVEMLRSLPLLTVPGKGKPPAKSPAAAPPQGTQSPQNPPNPPTPTIADSTSAPNKPVGEPPTGGNQ